MSREAPTTGDGPGVITPDGSAVDFYASLPLREEHAALVHAAVPKGGAALDLGAGTGNLAHPLADLGHEVVAVDESPEMLAHIHGARTWCGRIEDARLGRTFDAVLLASQLVNVPGDDVRARLLAACRRHVRDGGTVLIERLTRAWVDTVESSSGEVDGVAYRLRVLDRPGPGLLTAAVDYRLGEREWTQTFTARGLDDAELAGHLHRAGLRFARRVSDDGRWIEAHPIPADPGGRQ